MEPDDTSRTRPLLSFLMLLLDDRYPSRESRKSTASLEIGHNLRYGCGDRFSSPYSRRDEAKTMQGGSTYSGDPSLSLSLSLLVGFGRYTSGTICIKVPSIYMYMYMYMYMYIAPERSYIYHGLW